MCGLTADDVRSATFERPPWGKRGYDEKSVDDFLQLVARRLDVWIYRDENTALRAAAELAMSILSLRTPRRRENWVGSPADADAILGPCEPVHELGAGARPGRVTHCCFEHAGQNFGSLDRGPRAAHPM